MPADSPSPTSISRVTSFLVAHPVRSTLLVGLDALIAALALTSAELLRFEGANLPSEQFSTFLFSLPILVSIRAVFTLAAGLHRWSFRMSGLHEAIRLAATTAFGTVAFVSLFFFVHRVAPPRSVIALEFFFTTTLMATYRYGPRAGTGWFKTFSRSQRDDAQRTLIIGAGSAGDLLLRDLERSDAHRFHLVGFIDDDPRKVGTSLGGLPVLGKISELPIFVSKLKVSNVLIAIPRLSGERVREILGLCATLKVSFKIIPASFTYLDEKVTAAMLHDLSPDDLLPRDPVAFDRNEVSGLIAGRRILVTGAGGSIGSEIARQLAAHGPEQLLLLDMNENELYFLQRRLQELYPHLKVLALVADIRDAAQMEWLGRTHRPQDIFHAAAHKHVPLMEDMPAEAVKNNVMGTLNVAVMADVCGAERFVLISTDKAVRPTSIMGVSKRVAELVVRDLARRSKTRFTAVRFGNVLGSAGSVVPLFKQQIERGGPVTVTHPDCTRYFMTIPEAVGLVLIAGLTHPGELCILDMGEAIRIADLAANMITMTGRVPNVDIPIVFTGLRPGEKLFEELFTEEEEKTQKARNKIMVAEPPPPPVDLSRKLEELRRAADVNDREALVVAFQGIVPSYKPPEHNKPALRLISTESKAG